MRRNLTISFDEAWINFMDGRRGKMSRGTWLEAHAGQARFPPIDPPSPKATRSPKAAKCDRCDAEIPGPGWCGPCGVAIEAEEAAAAKVREEVEAGGKRPAAKVVAKAQERGLPLGWGGVGGKPPIPKRGK